MGTLQEKKLAPLNLKSEFLFLTINIKPFLVKL
jgi:hypothetical protein